MGATVRGSADEAPGYDRMVVMAVAVEDYQNAPGRPAITDVQFALDDRRRSWQRSSMFSTAWCWVIPIGVGALPAPLADDDD